jgi:hypothetical protein
MFGLHIHKWVTLEGVQLVRKRYDVIQATYNVYIQQCEVCGKMRTQKVKL